MKYPVPVWPYSPYFRAWNILFCSWQVWINPEKSLLVEWWIEEETHQVIRNISWVLEENNLTLEDVVKTTIYLKNISDFSKVNNIYWKFFAHRPARTTIEVSNLPLWALIEIEVIASF
jgi:2-iminobutanoate/2-iminopropanoate deaminase